MNFVLSSIYWRHLMKASLFGSPNFCWWSCKLWWRPFWRSTLARIDFVRTMTMPIILIYSMMRSTQASVNNHGYLNPVFKTPRPRNSDTKKILQRQIYENPLFFAANEARLSKKYRSSLSKEFQFSSNLIYFCIFFKRSKYSSLAKKTHFWVSSSFFLDLLRLMRILWVKPHLGVCSTIKLCGFLFIRKKDKN